MRKWLIAIRKKLRRTQKQVADQAGIARNYYCQIETGARNPSVKVAKAIANALGFKWTVFFETGYIFFESSGRVTHPDYTTGTPEGAVENASKTGTD